MTRPIPEPPEAPTGRNADALRQMARPTRTHRGVLEPRDLFASDADCEAFMRDARDHWRVGCLMRQCSTPKRKRRYMSKRAYRKWKAALYDLDDDKPLRDCLNV